MNLEEIRGILVGMDAKPIGRDRYYAVLVPLININNELNIMFEVRSMTIKRQPGEISFPGGKVELGESCEQAAIRETCEETTILKENIEIIGKLDYLTSRDGKFIYPFLGYIKDINYLDINYSMAEVSELFFVPLSHFIQNESEKYYVDYYPKICDGFPYDMIQNGKNYKWDEIRHLIHFYKYEKYIIWGLTAKIIDGFVKR